MRSVPEALSAAIESGAAQLCHAWIVKRRDGTRLGFTDHDRPLTVEGVVCSAASGWTAGAAEGRLGPAPGTASAAGVLDDAAVTAEDLDAEVEKLRVLRPIVLLAGHQQQILLRGDLDLVAAEAGDGQRDAVAIVGDSLQVERRIIFSSAARVRLDHVEKTIEADGRAAVGGQVETHVQILQ